MSEKSGLERIVNPFGDPWASRPRLTGDIPVATSSLIGMFRQPRFEHSGRFAANGEFQLSESLINYHRRAASEFHYDESVAKLSDDMLEFKKIKKTFEAAGLKKRFIGYSTINFVETPSMPGYLEASEDFFLHRPGTPPSKENRVRFADSGALNAGGDIFDIRSPDCREYLANNIARAMNANGLDCVLLDYAASQHSFGAWTPDLMPSDWFEHFEANQFALLTAVTAAAEKVGKTVFCNGLTLDGVYDTAVEKARLYLSACHGAFWEQPFRTEWRDVKESPDAYYDLLDRFFGLAVELGRTIIVKQGTYRFYGTEEINPGWNWRFASATAERERSYVCYFLAFYLLFADRKRTPLIYTHPTEVLDIFASEAYFKEFDIRLGKADSGRVKLADHVFSRPFEEATVVLNNSDAEFRATVPTSRRGRTAEVILPPQSGAIYPI